MSTSQLGETPVELPGMPNKRALNISQTGEPTEYYFEKRYGEYKDVPYYEEAKRLYLHKRINSQNECGVNTWHEQLIAGRVTPDDVKTIGYTNIAYFNKWNPFFLPAMTNPERMMDARTVRAIMDSSRNSFQYGPVREEKSHPQVAIHKTYFLGFHFGADVVRSLRNHTGICNSAQTLIKLNKSDPAKALEVIQYIEDYYNELRPLLVEHELPENFYRDNEFLKLMEAGVTPKQAAEGTVQGLSVERAVEAVNVASTFAEGVL
jgi:hypothetical protein